MRIKSKFLFNLARKFFYVGDRIVRLCIFDKGNGSLARFEEFEMAVRKKPFKVGYSTYTEYGYPMMIDVIVLEYAHGCFIVPEERMRRFLLDIPLDNFERIKKLKELYLL